MADGAESAANSSVMTTKKDKEKTAVAASSKEADSVRKSTRLKQHAKFEKHMSMFVMQSKKSERRRRSSDSSSDGDEVAAKVPRKSEKKEPKVPVRVKDPKSSPKKLPEIKKELSSPSSSSSEEEEEVDPNDKDFSLSMLNLRRVGDSTPAPRSEKNSIQLNARGMPQRIRKKNRLFFDDNVVSMPVKNKQKREGKAEKKIIHRVRTKNDRKEEEPAPPPTIEDSKEANNVRQRIGMRLRNLLKLPKAQRWVFYEWFYSNIDHVLFYGNNDFLQCVKETFTHLRTTQMARTDWCVVRRLLGKPRRCSQSFFREERKTLERRRNVIRMVQQRKLKDILQCRDLPDRIPLQLSVNSRVTAKLRHPQSGLFTGKVDAVDPSNHTYRITFDRSGLGTHSIPDYEVLLHGDPDMVSISTMQKRYQTSKLTTPKPKPQTPLTWSEKDSKDPWADPVSTAKFPRQFYEMIVRICKILKEKRIKVQTLKEMNSDGEKMMSLGETYPELFQKRYASFIVELESLNISLERYLTAVQKYCHKLAPDVCSSAMLAPSYIRDKSISDARELVSKFFSNRPPLKSSRINELVHEFLALIIQVQNLRSQKVSTQERQTLKQSLTRIKSMISPKNQLVFQNCVEVHIQYIETTQVEGTNLSPLLASSATSK